MLCKVGELEVKYSNFGVRLFVVGIFMIFLLCLVDVSVCVSIRFSVSSSNGV